MKILKIAYIMPIMLLPLFLTGCSDQAYSGTSYEDRIQELEEENQQLQDRNSSLEDSIDEANDEIRDAQNNAWEDYDTTGETLEDLNEFDY